MWNVMMKRRHKIKAMKFMLMFQRKLTYSKSQDLTSRILRKQLK
jgi:hypothetical protein